MGKVLIVIVVLVVIGLLLFGPYIGVRNTLVTKNEAVKAAWSQVDIVLQRRADLIPNLVNTVKGYAQQEQTVFGEIANARAALLSARDSAGQDRRQPAPRRCPRPLACGGRELSQSQIERKFLAPAGRISGHREPHRRRAQALQRHLAGLQHLHPAVSAQHLCRLGGIQSEQRLLRGFGRFSRSPESGLQ